MGSYLPTALSFVPNGSNILLPKIVGEPLAASSIVTAPKRRNNNRAATSLKNLNFNLLKKRLAIQKKLFGQKKRHLRLAFDPTNISTEESNVAATVVQGLDGTAGETSCGIPITQFQETPARSAVKALMWRFIAGSVTFATSLKFSNGSISTALSLVGSDFISKVATMFIGERIMNRSSAGRTTGNDSVQRSLIKALIWRLFAIFNTLTVAIFISKDWNVASKIAGSDAIIKTMMMYGYERIWSTMQWGKEYHYKDQSE